MLKTKSGISKVYFVELPKDVQKRFGYDTDKIAAEQAAERAAEDKRVEEQKAAQQERAKKGKKIESKIESRVLANIPDRTIPSTGFTPAAITQMSI